MARKVDVARRNRDEIGRDRLVHDEAEGAAAIAQVFRLALRDAAHHDVERLGRGDPRFPCLANAGAVLRRDPGAVEDRLPLAEKERMLAARGLLRGEPLQRRGALRRAIGDAQLLRPVELDRQRHAHRSGIGDRHGHRPVQRAASPVGHALDLQPVRVEHDLLRARCRQHAQVRRPAHALRCEIEVEVERHMRHARLLRHGISHRVARFGRGQDGRDHRRACGHVRRGVRRYGGAGRGQAKSSESEARCGAWAGLCPCE